MKNKILIVLVFALIIAFTNVSAEGILGVSPGQVRFSNVLRGGYAERYITLTISSEDNILITTSKRGEIADWINITENISIKENIRERVLVSVSPPSDIPNGNYTGYIRISAEKEDKTLIEQHATSDIKTVIDIYVVVEITDREIIQCRVSEARISSAEKNEEAILSMKILNRGNVRINPLIEGQIWDKEQITMLNKITFNAGEILPTKEETIEYKISTNDLEINQYWLNLLVPDCFSEKTLTFDVLEEGAIRSQGELISITTPKQVKTGETIPIIASFRNTGEKQINAQFKGQITRQGRIVQIIESEILNVPINELESFTTYFTPKQEGRYVVTGRVFYDQKRTFERSASIEATRDRFFNNHLTTIIYVILTIIVIITLYKIRIEKRKYLEKLNKISKNEV